MKSLSKGNLTTIILTFLLGFFFINSIILKSFFISQYSLHFKSEDYDQILDSSPSQRKEENFFYQSSSISVFNLDKNSMNDVDLFLTKNLSHSKNQEIEITFSEESYKKNFFKLINNKGKKHIPLKQFISKNARMAVSGGEVCFLNNCISEYIAIKHNGIGARTKEEI